MNNTFKAIIIKAVSILFDSLSDEFLYELNENPWDPEFSLEDSWIEIMDPALFEEYDRNRDDICKWGLNYYLKKFAELKCTH